LSQKDTNGNEIEKCSSCFTYEVSLIIQVVAHTRDEADAMVDSNSGFLSKRTVKLRDIVHLYDGHKEPIG
jgi:hypothetical protein